MIKKKCYNIIVKILVLVPFSSECEESQGVLDLSVGAAQSQECAPPVNPPLGKGIEGKERK